MVKLSTLARWDYKLRPFITKLPAKWVISFYSQGRTDFLDLLKKECKTTLESHWLPENAGRTLWGIQFRAPIMNAAGMFKDWSPEWYRIVALQGAGGYLGGTGTWKMRTGNAKHGVYLPFVPYPRSRAASNYLDLPNAGDQINSEKLSRVRRINYCPLGWSIMGSPDLHGEERLKRLIDSMKLYEQGRVDFLEINESCPNTVDVRPQDDDLGNRLHYIKERFLDERPRRLPVIVKFSTDTAIEQVPALLDLLFELGFDGVDFGNTSTDYAYCRAKIDKRERRLYDFFVQKFGGGVSGAPLKERSLALAARAVEYRKAGPPSQEFHIVRTGGIENHNDIQESDRAGVSLNLWFSGYFDNFARYGHDLYSELFKTAKL